MARKVGKRKGPCATRFERLEAWGRREDPAGRTAQTVGVERLHALQDCEEVLSRKKSIGQIPRRQDVADELIHRWWEQFFEVGEALVDSNRQRRAWRDGLECESEGLQSYARTGGKRLVVSSSKIEYGN